MSEEFGVSRISRRRSFSLICLTAGLGLAAPTILTASNAEAQGSQPQGQTQGQGRRDDRQEGRQDRRDDRQEGREERQDDRQEGRQQRQDERRN